MAIVIIFLLLAANFQSFKLSLAILSSVPAVLAGSLLMLLAFGATLNLQSYMGMIMSVGVSVANAILMVTNAENLRKELKDARQAGLMAANSRMRPILMTSIAMIAGMIPMASGMGEGGDQVAPLGQAVMRRAYSIYTCLVAHIARCIYTGSAKSFAGVGVADPEDTESPYYNGLSTLTTACVRQSVF